MAEDDTRFGAFPTTRLSALVGAGSADEAERRRSWEAIVAAYWKPAYKHVRLRWRRPREDAEDLVQAFFERAMERDFFETYAPQRARFRTFLRLCLDRFVANREKARGRLKRGGGATQLSLDFDGAEDELARIAVGATPSPEELFDREWQRAVFTIAVAALRAHCQEIGRPAVFAAFQRYDLVSGGERPTYEAIARELGVPATTITNHLAYARRELRRLVVEGLAAITVSGAELRAEAADLLGGDVD